MPKHARIPAFALVSTLAVLAAASSLNGQALGVIDFPTSGSAEAQPHFIQGVLFMHNFEYEDAGTHFRMAQEIDPGFAMAYWGEALSYNHAVWQRQDTEKATAALKRLAPTPEARAAKAGTQLEKRWLHTVEVLIGTDAPGTGADKQTRDDLYRDAMRRLYKDHPEDHEVAAFYALSILGTAHEGRDFATYMRAAAVVEPVFDQNPEHPGAAHYLIHSYDDPVHAPLGLPMARAYSVIAPSAGHAQHMTSHIFVAMGMWEDVVTANEVARDVQNARQARLDRPPVVCGHYTYWLQYGYLQQGRHQQAKQVLDTCYERIQAEPSGAELGYFANMRARYFFDTGDVETASHYTVAWDRPNPNYQVVDAVAAGIAGDFDQMKAIRQSMVDGLSASDTEGTPTQTQVLVQGLGAGIAFFEGRGDEAVRAAAVAAELEAAMPYEFGPPAIVKPMFELLGEFLQSDGRHAEAMDAFRSQLDRTPLRTASMLGLARSAQAAGDQVVADEVYAALVQIWSEADPGIEGLEEAKTAEQDGADMPARSP